MDPEIKQELEDMAETICELCKILHLVSTQINEINTKIDSQLKPNPT